MKTARRSLALVAALVCSLGTAPGAAVAPGAQTRAEPVSRLEALYSARAGQPLRLYGRELFAPARVRAQDAIPRDPAARARPLGAVPDDTRLGFGDELQITLRGAEVSGPRLVQVDAGGHLVIPELPPIAAAGRRLDAVRADIEAELTAVYPNASAHVAVVGLRELRVLVVGDVARPGRHTLGPFDTVFDALLAAGGVTPQGSLRRLHIAGPGTGAASIPVDLYALLLGAVAGDVDGTPAASRRLRDGDRLLVPSLGRTVGVAGAVRRPAIYELAPGGSGPVSATALLALAGGPLSGAPGQPGLRLMRLSRDAVGRDWLVAIEDPDAARFDAGDLLLVQADQGPATGQVSLLGPVRAPGPHPLRLAPTLEALLAAGPDPLLPGAYPLLGVIDRFDRRRLVRRLLPFSPLSVYRGRDDQALQDGDRVLIFETDRLRALFGDAVPGDPLDTPDDPDDPDGLARAERRSDAADRLGLDPRAVLEAGPGRRALLTGTGGTTAPGPWANRAEPFARAGPEAEWTTEAGAQAGGTAVPLDAELRAFLAEHTVRVRGAVRRPGRYPVAGRQAVVGLLDAAGGFAVDADRSRIEILSDRPVPGVRIGRSLVAFEALQRHEVRPGDAIRVAPRFGALEAGTVQVQGEVRAPGRYDFRRGETLSMLLARAGGLTLEAYPAGAVFTRASVRAAERARFLRAAQELERIAALALMEREETDPRRVEAAQRLAADLRSAEPVGRVVVEADPAVLTRDPRLDILLQAGDRILIPKRPLSVTVAGEVQAPGARQFVSGKTAEDYLEEAGGPTRFADEDRAYVVMPDGSARTISLSFWNFSPLHLPPGTTLYLPRGPEPLDYLELTETITRIFSQLAISAASLSVIQRE